MRTELSTADYVTEMGGGLRYPAQGSDAQPLGETTRGVVKAPSVEAPSPQWGPFPALGLPAGSPEVELSLTAWAGLGSSEQLPRLSPRARSAAGTPAGIVIVLIPNIRRRSPLAAPFTIPSAPAQAQHRSRPTPYTPPTTTATLPHPPAQCLHHC